MDPSRVHHKELGRISLWPATRCKHCPLHERPDAHLFAASIIDVFLVGMRFTINSASMHTASRPCASAHAHSIILCTLEDSANACL